MVFSGRPAAHADVSQKRQSAPAGRLVAVRRDAARALWPASDASAARALAPCGLISAFVRLGLLSREVEHCSIVRTGQSRIEPLE